MQTIETTLPIVGSLTQQELADIQAHKVNQAIDALFIHGSKFKSGSHKVLMMALDHAVTHQTGTCVNNFWKKMGQCQHQAAQSRLKKYIQYVTKGLVFDDKGVRAQKGADAARVEVLTDRVIAMGENWMDAKVPSKPKSTLAVTPKAEALKALDALAKKDGCDLVAAVLAEFLQSPDFEAAYIKAAYERTKAAEVASGDVIEGELAEAA